MSDRSEALQQITDIAARHGLSAEEIMQALVDYTIVGGRVVYTR